MTDTPWTPGPWLVIASRQDDAVKILASGNPLKIAGRTKRASTNRAVLSAAPEMAELLGEFIATWNKFYQRLPREAENEEFGVVQNARSLLARIRGATP